MFVKKSQAIKKQSDPSTTVFEYGLNSKKIGVARAIINGRHPSRGKIINTKCALIYCCLSGQGRVVIKNKKYDLSAGDALLIEKNTAYYVKGKKFEIVLPSSPAWTPEQYQETK